MHVTGEGQPVFPLITCLFCTLLYPTLSAGMYLWISAAVLLFYTRSIKNVGSCLRMWDSFKRLIFFVSFLDASSL